MKTKDIIYPKTLIQLGTLTVFLLLCSVNYTQAQKNEVGLGGGVSFYTGDLQPEIRFKYSSPVIQLFYRRNFSSAWSFRAGLSFGQLREGDIPGHDTFAKKRQAAFSGKLYELAGLIEYNFMDYKAGKGFLPFTPFLFGGIALAGHNSEAYWLTADNSGAPNGQKVKIPYKQPALFALPFGAGIKYSLSNRFELNAEFGARYLFNDKIDHITGAPDPLPDGTGRLPDDFNYGNSNDNDWYYFMTVSVSYTFYKIHCAYDFYR
ncbi:MAG: DUF6089 family protein [Cytophagales bacterium]|nr:DUF6089 family protein [Cytophagales bacterium]